jgi:hypothetical protein
VETMPYGSNAADGPKTQSFNPIPTSTAYPFSPGHPRSDPQRHVDAFPMRQPHVPQSSSNVSASNSKQYLTMPTLQAMVPDRQTIRQLPRPMHLGLAGGSGPPLGTTGPLSVDHDQSLRFSNGGQLAAGTADQIASDDGAGWTNSLTSPTWGPLEFPGPDASPN